MLLLISAFMRFTPTGVGTMQCGLNQMHSLSVHPHGRGDNVVTARYRRLRCGSPPRAWGQCR